LPSLAARLLSLVFGSKPFAFGKSCELSFAMYDAQQQSGAILRRDKPPSNPPVHALKLLRRWATLSWAGWLLSIGLLWWQHWMRVLHPPSLLFIFLVALTFGSALAALGTGFWRMLRGPKRLGASTWLLVALLPVLSWTALALYAYRNGQKANVPRNLAMMLMMRVGHSLMEAQAAYFYPHRLESQRLVMFYTDEVTDPEGDLQAMDQHVADMEERMGRPLRAKIYWARGSLLGQRNLCCFGITLGSDRSPASRLDRHELAHAVINQHTAHTTDPPTLLSEGWAESQADDSKVLAERAVGLRWHLTQLAKLPKSEAERGLDVYADREGSRRLLQIIRDSAPGAGSYLRELTDMPWYYRDRGAVYEVGGAFVSFLIRKYGAARFVEFYVVCQAGTFEADCRRMFGADVDALEKEFWEDAERLDGRQLPR